MLLLLIFSRWPSTHAPQPHWRRVLTLPCVSWYREWKNRQDVVVRLISAFLLSLDHSRISLFEHLVRYRPSKLIPTVQMFLGASDDVCKSPRVPDREPTRPNPPFVSFCGTVNAFFLAVFFVSQVRTTLSRLSSVPPTHADVANVLNGPTYATGSFFGSRLTFSTTHSDALFQNIFCICSVSPTGFLAVTTVYPLGVQIFKITKKKTKN